MQVDRTSFLLLASALAASCAPRHEGTTASVSTPAPATSSAAPAPTATTEPAVIGSPAKESAPPPTFEGAPPPPPMGEGYWPAPTGEGWVPPPTPSKPPPPFNSNACAGDDVGTPASCAGLKFDKSCNPFPFVTGACNDAIKFYKPKIAERAVACIRKLGSKQLCDALYTYKCKDNALRSACVDSSADASCAQIVSACKGTSMSECRGYLAGMNATGRAAMVKCMSNPTYCGFGLYSCTESL